MKNNVETEILLSVKDLIVEYKSEGGIIHAVNGVSFEIKKGETVGLVGETGAGKTTIAKSILRISTKSTINYKKWFCSIRE
jgi:peptide/nickel transport system ATP-binding protein